MTRIVTEKSDVDAREAIGMSIRENRIVRIVDETGSNETTLDELCEDHVRSGSTIEFWGTRDSDGQSWRVHIVDEAR